MILIAPDKFKGTLSAVQAATIIASALDERPTIMAPMADGGEGTAAILCAGPEWEKRLIHGQHTEYYYVNEQRKIGVIDSSAVIGMLPENDILRRSSFPLGALVREILMGGCEKVIIGVGGTGICDGGEGFLEGIGIEKYHLYQNKLIGLCDVSVPLLPSDGDCFSNLPSALMFAKQKGATPLDMPILLNRLRRVYGEYGCGSVCPFDGAGGGLGFAIGNAIGASCFSGAEYVLESYNIDWSEIDLVITGEGKIDGQTAQGKVVSVVSRVAAIYNKPVIAFGGTVENGLESDTVISTDKYSPDLVLNHNTAELRLRNAVKSNIGLIDGLRGGSN